MRTSIDADRDRIWRENGPQPSAWNSASNASRPTRLRSLTPAGVERIVPPAVTSGLRVQLSLEDP